MNRAIVPLLILLLTIGALPAGAQNPDALTFRQVFFSLFLGTSFPGPMANPFATVVSSDGDDVYVSSGSISHFRRNPIDGTLEYVDTISVSMPNQPASVGAHGITLSSDGKFLYTAMSNHGTFGGIARLNRNLNTGELTPGGAIPDDGFIIPGLHNPFYIAASPDDKNLYVLSDQFFVSPYYSPALAVVSTDPSPAR